MFYKPYDKGGLKANCDNNEYETQGESLTQQQFADDCDINLMLKRFTSGGMAFPPPVQGLYLDSSEFKHVSETHEIRENLNLEFSALPADIRLKFDNNHLKYGEYLVQQSELSSIEEKNQFYQKLYGDNTPQETPTGDQKNGLEPSTAKAAPTSSPPPQTPLTKSPETKPK